MVNRYNLYDDFYFNYLLYRIEPGCLCSSFNYVPKNGSQAIRCLCKHESTEHKPSKPFSCSKGSI